MPPKYGLGRLYVPDDRDKRFPLAKLLPANIRRTGIKLWDIGPILDQGETPECVGYASRNWLNAAPLNDTPSHYPSAQDIYTLAQPIDGIPMPHEGTTIRAAEKVLQQQGDVVSYHWSTEPKDMAAFILNYGPMILGTVWTAGMFYPRRDGLVSMRGEVVGGHAFLVYGVDTFLRHFFAVNSWGEEWADNGKFTLTYYTMGKLLAQDGEACAILGQHLPHG